MSTQSHVSLIDLAKQIPFEITNELKKELCFGETLIISCGHYEGDIHEEASESEWTCNSSSTSVLQTEAPKDDKVTEIKDFVQEESIIEEESEDDDNFQFFFYPDCDKPMPQNGSKSNVIMVDGQPKLNSVTVIPKKCKCKKSKRGSCECFVKYPCKCGAKVKRECTCVTAKDICICEPDVPKPVCTCGRGEVCVCFPDKSPRPVCTCKEVEKPCVCNIFPKPVCLCDPVPVKKIGKEKDRKGSMEKERKESTELTGEQTTTVYTEPTEEVTTVVNTEPTEATTEFLSTEHGEESNKTNEQSALPEEETVTSAFGEIEYEHCRCQKVTKPVCFCRKGEPCICQNDDCFCLIHRHCICEKTGTEEIPCKDAENKSICSCEMKLECTCGESPDNCKCFERKLCTCGNPDDCKCFKTCECSPPCVCDLKASEKECICRDPAKQLEKGLLCTCGGKRKESSKLKKVRAGKHGYRWCHQVDPRHTFFDYGFISEDKIAHTETDFGKVHILGLHEDKEAESETCPVHGVKAPPYKKKIRKPSLDCCSAVGGITITVEILGEDRDKFLIQIVSNSSKEGSKTGSKLISIVDMNLHTMEENRSEHITKRDATKERRSYVSICENGYYNKVTRVCGEQSVVKRFYHTFEDARNFLLEGANIVLMRYFGLRRYRGTVKTDTLLVGGQICESIYVCLGVSQAIVNSKPLFVVKVERHIIEPSGNVHQTLTVLTLRGYTVSHEWADNCYVLHINPLLSIVPEKDLIEPHAPLRDRWREDLQLFSDYLDMKSTRTAEGGRYVTESGELTETIRDYMQALLLLKPVDALHFTRHYFSSVLSSLDLPHDEYFNPCAKHVRYFYFED